MRLPQEKIRDMIDKEMLKNGLFSQRAQVLFVNESNMTEEEDDEKGPNLLDSVLQEDIFFEIAEEPADDQQWDFEGIERKQMPKYQNCVLHLNGVDQRLIKNSRGSVPQQTLHNILQFGNGDFQRLVPQGSDAVRQEIFVDLSILQGSEEVSLIKLIIGLILTHSENKDDVLSLLKYLASRLTSLYYDNSTQLFD